MKKMILVLGLLVIAAMVLAACQPAASETVIETVIETVVVEKEAETVIETVVVEKEVIVDPTECNLDAPAEKVEINMIGWSFAITDYYAEELMKCDKVENLTVNTNLLASADAQG